MKHIIAITLAPPHYNFDKELNFLGEKFRVTQYGTDFDTKWMEELILKYDGVADVLTLSGLPSGLLINNKMVNHDITVRMRSLVKKSVVVDGMQFRETYSTWALRDYIKKNYGEFNQKKIGIYSGTLSRPLVNLFSEFSNQITLADPYLALNLPYTLKKPHHLDFFLKTFSSLVKKLPLKKNQKTYFQLSELEKYPKLANFCSSQVFVANAFMLNFIDPAHLKNKLLILDFLSSEMELKLKQAGVKKVINCTPSIAPDADINFAILEALFLSVEEPEHIDFVTSEMILEWINNYNLKPTVKVLNNDAKLTGTKRTFAFIIHPLSSKYLFKAPLLKPLKPVQKQIAPFVEKMTSNFDGVLYGKIAGIKSDFNGQEVDGLIYSVYDTPKMLLQQKAETVYKKLNKLCDQAAAAGAEIIGLGAYTKIVGDAGITVAQNSPIPVTTGNALSAAATLWAAKVAATKMGFIKFNKNETKTNSRAMIIGATGSIGSVSAKLLATYFKEIYIVAPRAQKLLELKSAIEEISPGTIVYIATDPNPYVGLCDLIITSTSNQGERILDIMQVKPGCVICDVSRPLDISEEDAVKRPDVLVIQSGEVELPGNVKVLCDLGLSGTTVYACLAETALLAMEGRLECYTLSRNISLDKVKEIYKLCLKHGVTLASIMGHNGKVTDQEIELCRELALKKLTKPSIKKVHRQSIATIAPM